MESLNELAERINRLAIIENDARLDFCKSLAEDDAKIQFLHLVGAEFNTTTIKRVTR